MKDFISDFDYFTNLINSDINFAFSRYADGEVALMKGNEVGEGTQAHNVDKWKSPNNLTKVGHELLETLNHTEDNYFYAISSHTDNLDDFEFLSKNIKNLKNITFANLWINANYHKMKLFYENITKNIYVICNHRANKESFPFKVADIFPFPDNCVEYWDQHGKEYLENLTKQIQYVENQTFFISCGPISEIIIHHLFNFNPKNKYIDVGSSIDEFVHGYKTRPYMDDNSYFSKQISIFENL